MWLLSSRMLVFPTCRSELGEKGAEAVGSAKGYVLTSRVLCLQHSTGPRCHRSNPDTSGWRGRLYFFITEQQVCVTEELGRREITLCIWKPVAHSSFFIMLFPLKKKILSCKFQLAGVLFREIISQESLPLDVSDHLKAYRNPGLQSLSLKAAGALSVWRCLFPNVFLFVHFLLFASSLLLFWFGYM